MASLFRPLLAVCTAPLLLAGCGLRGDLERPVPLWGNPPIEGPNDPRVLKAEAEREAARQDAAQAQEEGGAAPGADPAPPASPN